MAATFRFSVALLFLLSVSVLTGCSGNVGSVEGVVTLDGDPLPFATVSFHPTEGRASGGKTDEAGHYTLVYMQGQNGAIIGEHKVTVSTLEFAEENRNVEYDDDPTKPSKGNDETMPAKYRELSQTELKATVKGGKNEIDFKLTSGE